MSEAKYEMKPNGNSVSKSDLIIEEKTMKSSSSHLLAFGMVVVLAIGAIVITALVLTLGDTNPSENNSIIGIIEPSQVPSTTTQSPTNPTSAASTTLTTATTVSDPPVTNPSGETAPPNGGEPSQAPSTTTQSPTNPTSAASTTLTTATTVSDPPVTNPSGETAPPNNGGVPSQCSMYPCDSSCDMSSPPCNGLIFQEEFNSLNLDIWEHEITAGGGGNWEFQYYTNNRSNSYVKDGKLFIKPTLTEDLLGEGSVTSSRLDLWGASPANLCTGNAWWGCDRTGTADNILNPIQSARLRTVDSFSFKYGRLEVEAKLPTGDWLWPAIWLLPTRNAYGNWPASGEIDLVESRGNADMKYGEVSAGVDQMGSTMHWGPFWPLNGYPKTHATKNLPDGQTFGSGFHKYVLDWTMDSMKFFVDDEEILSVDPGSGFWEFGEFADQAPGIDNPWGHSTNKFTPFDQEFYLILNVAVGGVNYFGDTATYNPPKPWTNDSPTAARDFWNARNDWLPTWDGEEAAMQVNYVRVYAEDGQTTYHLRDR
ncbi:beta-1,3-glucan-binding protein-like isoform X3 [Lytechinus variegatus]|uniref:beta-1,3-glucan-binding protein-like isoform X3 n=1 Tax=Lytechinus variegatus TaxID=7654 RepID=UPI001BB16B69|nr:beta-1,3-glucan-binding protein-like isoform X3 [Lytechinus variegatus]